MTELQMWIAGVGATVGVAAFLRLCPKSRLIAWAQATGDKLGKLLSTLMLVRVGRKASESIEEGPIVTLLATAQAFIDAFGKGLLYDNQDRQPK